MQIITMGTNLDAEDITSAEVCKSEIINLLPIKLCKEVPF